MNSLFDVIKQRYSCRSFQLRPIDHLIKSELQSYINSNSKGLWGEDIEIKIIERNETFEKGMKLDYGIIVNHCSYILGKVKNELQNRLSYGFVMEKIVLKATALGLNSCWVGYFDPDFFFEIESTPGFEIPSIVIIGYAGKSTFGEKIIRFSAGSKNRREWSNLFFLDTFKTPLQYKKAGLYQDALEMLRLAPSSGNTQPWRVIMESNGKKFHFFKKVVSPRYEAKGLHDIDVGIGLAHFDLVSKQYRLNGSWKKVNDIHLADIDNIEYVISWIENEGT